jgi:putative flippase GtrA
MNLVSRWAAFNAVGLAGVAVQLGLLAALVHAGTHYLLATALAVEAAVLHNFLWHQRLTWRDRPAASGRGVAARLARFHALNGIVSLVGNVALMALLAGRLHVDPLVANLIAIVTCSIVNFAASERLVFRSSAAAVALVLLGGLATPAHAGPGPATVNAWRAYESTVDARYASASPSGVFFALDARGGDWRAAARRGEVPTLRVEAPGAPGGRIHHWAAAVFVPNISVADVVSRLQRFAGSEADAYTDVIASKLLSRDGDRLRVFMKLRRTTVITVTYNTEHDVAYRRLGGARASSRSVATKIAELADAGTPKEREKADDDDNGFLWRLNAYWRYEQVDGGVLIECESVSLSRGVPALIRPVAAPIIDRVARESLVNTLRELRGFLTRPT